jgi:8-oxo-dGTP pyrophosphatase MutT (NUDIX family)
MQIELETVRRALQGRAHVATAHATGDRLAAVAAVLRQGRQGAEVLLIRRARCDGDPWSGHMAMPGGRRAATDPDLVHTAVRETLEEVGLPLDRERNLLGPLDELPAMARGKPVGMVIAPFVFEVHGEPQLVPCEREVAEILWAPLGPMARGERDTVLKYDHEGGRYDLPGYDVDGRIVWGLTHRMLRSLLEAVLPFAVPGRASP